MTRLLIVEDSPTQTEALRFILESEGFAVEAVSDGEKGLQRLLATRFDAVISDIMMPSMSGYEFCQAVRARPEPELAGLPIMLLTTLSDPMDIIRGLECGADNFSTKPYEPVALVNRVRSMLQNKTLRAGPGPRPEVESYFLGQAFPIRSDKEQILDMLLATFEDSVRTNRKLESRQLDLAAAKAKLREFARQLESREAKYARLIEYANEAMFVIDEAGVILEANRRAAALLDRSTERIVGRELGQFVKSADRAAMLAHIRALFANNQLRIRELEFQRGGAGVRTELSASVVEADGQRIALAIVRE